MTRCLLSCALEGSKKKTVNLITKKMNSYTNVVDNREREFPALLPTWLIKTLPVADFWIGISGDIVAPGAILIERKTIFDLEASIKDGRYREQRTRLQAFAEEHKAHVAYVIEGNLSHAQSFTKPVLWKWLLRLPFVHRIPILQTRNKEETAELLQVLAAMWQDDYVEFRDGKKTDYISTIKHTHTKGEQRDDPIVFAVTALSSCKGISPATAKVILEGCGGSFDNVMAASIEKLASIPNGKTKVGQAKAKKLFELLHFRSPITALAQPTPSLSNTEELSQTPDKT